MDNYKQLKQEVKVLLNESDTQKDGKRRVMVVTFYSTGDTAVELSIPDGGSAVKQQS